MLAGMGTSRAWGMAKEGASSACAPLSHICQGFWTSTFRFLGGCLDTVAVTACWCLLAGGRAIGKDERDKASQRRQYRLSVSDPTMISSTFWRPATSKTLSFLVEEDSLLQQMQSLKKGEVVHKGYAILNIAMKQLRIEREVNTRKQGGIPGLAALGPHFQPQLAHLPLLPRCMPSLSQIAPWWKP